MQKLYIILSLFICIGAVTVLSLSVDGVQPRALEDTANETIENARPNIDNPMLLEDAIVLNLNDTDLSTLITGTLTLAQTSVFGLNTILVPYLSMVLVGAMLTFQFVIPELRVETLLATDINILGILPIYGNDTAIVTINNAQINGIASVNLNGPTMTGLNAQLFLESLTLEVHGLQESEKFSEFASSLLTLLGNDLIVPYLNDNAEEVGKIISPILEDLIGGLLSEEGSTRKTNLPVQGMLNTVATILKEKIDNGEIPLIEKLIK